MLFKNIEIYSFLRMKRLLNEIFFNFHILIFYRYLLQLRSCHLLAIRILVRIKQQREIMDDT